MTTNCITIKYGNDSCLCPLPASTTTIKEFISQLKDELTIDATTPAILTYQNNRLLPSGTIQSYGIQPGYVLDLKVTVSQTLIPIRIQTLAGEQLCYSLPPNATFQDLFDVISKDAALSFTTTFPILFSHRMHLCPSNELLTNYLKLQNNINWDIDHVPHFYLFECKRQLETHHLDYDKSPKNEMFLATDNWQPLACVKQTDTAMSVYLITLRILSKVFLSNSEVETDSICASHLPQFLIVLRRFLFPPACLAFYHLIDGGLFQFEKQLVSEAFFRLFREMLPTSVVDSDVFLHTPQMFYNIFENAQHASTEHDSYQLVDLIKPVFNSAPLAPLTYFIEPVYQLGRSNDNLVLSELADVQKENKVADVDFIRQSDLIAFLEWMKQKSGDSNPSEKYFREYRIWLPPKDKSMFSLGNIFEQRSKIIRLSESELKTITDSISTTDVYSKLTFVKPSAFSKENHDQFVLLDNQHVVYLDRVEKSDDHTFLSFDPLDSDTTTFNTGEVAADELLLQYPSFAMRETSDDARRIEQITVVLFDVSASMKSTIVGSNQADQHNLLDLSVIALGTWSDKLISYRFPQAVGLIYFGAATNRSSRQGGIEEACSITRNLSQFEKALGRRPDCGGSTPLYDAIITAIEAIATYREKYKTKLNSDFRQLILCLSDGGNNCGTATLEMVKTRLQTEKIVFDCVSFTKCEAQKLVELCVSTKGYYHLNVPHDKELMTNLFELEATISVHGRDETVVGKIEKPKRRPPVELQNPAIILKEARMSSGQVTNRSLRNVTRELIDLKTNQLDNFIVFVSKENLFFWKVIMIGPTGTSYASYHWLLTLEFTSNYPIQPPEIRFITPIYHCNINDDGRICHEILRGQWTQKTTIRDVLMQILDLLSDPNAQDALSTSKGVQYAASLQNYQNEILEWKRKYASETVEALMAQYNLE